MKLQLSLEDTDKMTGHVSKIKLQIRMSANDDRLYMVISNAYTCNYIYAEVNANIKW